MKKCFVLICVFAVILNILSITVCAKELTSDELTKMSDYKYYCTFADALKNHDSYTLSLFIDCCSKYHGEETHGRISRMLTCEEVGCTAYKQFDSLKDIEISSYSVKILKNTTTASRPPAKITLQIDKGKGELFPEGKIEYYVLLDKYTGLSGMHVFKLYNQKSSDYNGKYNNIILGSAQLSSALNDFESMTEKQLKKVSYNAATIHVLYHAFFTNDFYGITESELNSDLKYFFNSNNVIDKDVLKELPQKDDMLFYMCGHGGSVPIYNCKKITRKQDFIHLTFGFILMLHK